MWWSFPVTVGCPLVLYGDCSLHEGESAVPGVILVAMGLPS